MIGSRPALAGDSIHPRFGAQHFEERRVEALGWTVVPRGESVLRSSRKEAHWPLRPNSLILPATSSPAVLKSTFLSIPLMIPSLSM